MLESPSKRKAAEKHPKIQKLPFWQNLVLRICVAFFLFQSLIFFLSESYLDRFVPGKKSFECFFWNLGISIFLKRFNDMSQILFHIQTILMAV